MGPHPVPVGPRPRGTPPTCTCVRLDLLDFGCSKTLTTVQRANLARLYVALAERDAILCLMDAAVPRQGFGHPHVRCPSSGWWQLAPASIEATKNNLNVKCLVRLAYYFLK